MHPVLKSIAALVAGFATASIVMMIVEWLNGSILYPGLAESTAGVTDRDTIRAILAAAPVGAFLVVLAGWLLGGLSGGWVTGKIADRSIPAHGLALGVLLTLAGVANNLMLSPPAWFWVASLLVFVPAAYQGARLAAK
ncbi:MAG: hypothetical protein ABIP44_11590 [Pseudoxanthomonas sp.]